MEQIILSRHGESVATARGIQNGDPNTDGGLTARGQEQARALGRQIAQDPIDLCVVSLFPRVQQTAVQALSGRAITCLVDPDLDDIRYGDFEGQPKDSYRAWSKTHGWTTPLPDGESRSQVAARLCSAFEAILGRAEHCALVVTHELLIDDLLRAVQGQPPAQVHGDIPFATRYHLTAVEAQRGITFLRGFLESVA